MRAWAKSFLIVLAFYAPLVCKYFTPVLGELSGLVVAQNGKIAGSDLAEIRVKFFEEIFVDVGGLPDFGHDLGGDISFPKFFLEGFIAAEHQGGVALTQIDGDPIRFFVVQGGGERLWGRYRGNTRQVKAMHVYRVYSKVEKPGRGVIIFNFA
ncbi:hypothetical protein [Desulfoluna sp.]|uniref:hypothetical protein n=1 Tax=Desulfoluna sp. TaxID=2045199 RepID=UPI00260A201B|nr:hypothetical protein [Desulfoluna sp.]